MYGLEMQLKRGSINEMVIWSNGLPWIGGQAGFHCCSGPTQKRQRGLHCHRCRTNGQHQQEWPGYRPGEYGAPSGAGLLFLISADLLLHLAAVPSGCSGVLINPVMSVTHMSLHILAGLSPTNLHLHVTILHFTRWNQYSASTFKKI